MADEWLIGDVGSNLFEAYNGLIEGDGGLISTETLVWKELI